MTRALTVVGGGLAGFTAAKELRDKGFGGKIRLVDPDGQPYDRPPLSKEYLAGKFDAAKLRFVAQEDWYVEYEIDLVNDVAVSIDPDAGSVTLASGQVIDGDVILLATGGKARQLPCPGANDPRLRYLRTMADADALREILVPGHRLAIVGAGLIGAEVASTAIANDVQTTLIDPMPLPGVALLGEELAAMLHSEHEVHGVSVKPFFTQSISRDGQVWKVALADGGTVAADTVLIAVGIQPDTAIAEAAGLAVDHGILVDAAQRSSHPKVFAAGDLARTHIAGVAERRHEHWESAMHEGQGAAAGILGQQPPTRGAPWMWSDRYGMHVEAVGDMTQGEAVTREVDGRPVMSFRLDPARKLLGAVAVDGGKAIRAARRIIDRGIVVDPEKLKDPGVDLKKLVR